MTRCMVLTGVAVACLAYGSDAAPGAGGGNPQFDRLKSLLGEWRGVSPDGDRAVSTFRLVGGGSAVLHVLSCGRQGESVTLYYSDGGELRADHYSRFKNQSRLVASPGAYSGLIRFTARETVNVGSHPQYEGALTLRLIDDDHHTELWREMDKGKAVRLAGTRFTRVR